MSLPFPLRNILFTTAVCQTKDLLSNHWWVSAKASGVGRRGAFLTSLVAPWLSIWRHTLLAVKILSWGYQFCSLEYERVEECTILGECFRSIDFKPCARLFCLWLTWCKEEMEIVWQGQEDTKPQPCFCSLNDFLPKCPNDFMGIARVWNGILLWRFCGFGLLSYSVIDRARREIFWCKGRFLHFLLSRQWPEEFWNSFVLHSSGYFFFPLYFLKSVNRKCMFSLKRNQKRPLEGLIDCSEIYFFIALFMFSHTAFSSFAPSCIFPSDLFWMALRISLGFFVLCSRDIQRAKLS